MKTILDHTIEESLITKNGWCLDLGCVDFKFTNQLMTMCDNVICVDANPNIISGNPQARFENKAVVSQLQFRKTAVITYMEYPDIQANCIVTSPKDHWNVKNKRIIETTCIEELMKKYNIKQFDLIKMDIEGAEYDILQYLDVICTKQLSVEFHDFRNMNPCYPDNQRFYREFLAKNEKYLDIAKHDWTSHPGFAAGHGDSYWDSLFILKKEFHLPEGSVK